MVVFYALLAVASFAVRGLHSGPALTVTLRPCMRASEDDGDLYSSGSKGLRAFFGTRQDRRDTAAEVREERRPQLNPGKLQRTASRSHHCPAGDLPKRPWGCLPKPPAELIIAPGLPVTVCPGSVLDFVSHDLSEARLPSSSKGGHPTSPQVEDVVPK